MKIEITQQASSRIQAQTFMSNTDVLNLLNENTYINLGHDLNKNNITHFLSYSRKDTKCFILVVEEKSLELIDILLFDNDASQKWSINPNAISCITNEDFQLNALNKSDIVKEAFTTTDINIYNILGDISKKNFKHRKPTIKTNEKSKKKLKTKIYPIGKGDFRKIVSNSLGKTHNKVSGRLYCQYKKLHRNIILDDKLEDIVIKNPKITTNSKFITKEEFIEMAGNILSSMKEKDINRVWTRYKKTHYPRFLNMMQADIKTKLDLNDSSVLKNQENIKNIIINLNEKLDLNIPTSIFSSQEYKDFVEYNLAEQ